MDIAGIGTHIVECGRVGRLLDRHAERFLAQVFTPREQSFCRGRVHSTEHYAAFWAAKEAVFRSLGTRWRPGTAWTEVEVVCATPAGDPTVQLAGLAAELAAGRGVGRVLVTLAHCRAYATATALALALRG